jgi:hypothetical protein
MKRRRRKEKLLRLAGQLSPYHIAAVFRTVGVLPRTLLSYMYSIVGPLKKSLLAQKVQSAQCN